MFNPIDERSIIFILHNYWIPNEKIKRLGGSGKGEGGKVGR